MHTSRVAIITGSGRGIGKEIALFLAKEGVNTVITSRTSADVYATVKLINQFSSAVSSYGIIADISKEEDCQLIIDKAIKHYGRIDILINNAAISGSTKPLEQCSVEDFNLVLKTNLISAFLLSKLSLPYMKQQSCGRIVNITSGAGIHPIQNMGLYGIAKSGINMLTQYLSSEMGKNNITVNAIHPGLVLTENTLKYSQSMADHAGITVDDLVASFSQSEHVNHIGRVTEAKEVAELVIFLCSSKAASLTGETICLGGGWFV